MSYLKGKWFILFCLLLCGFTCRAQNNPVYSQYLFNGLAINPAYAGSREVLNLAALYRTQWMNIDGAPRTQTLSGDFPLRNPQVALGLLVFNDKISIYRKTGVFATYAFRVKMNEGKLSFGLQAGFEQMREEQDKVHVIEPGDPMFDGEIHRLFMPNVGIGTYYYTSRYFAGLSIPKLLVYSPHKADAYKGKLSFNNVMLYGGMVFPISTNLKIRPSTLLHYEQKSILFDLNCNVILLPEETLEVGLSYRNSNVMVAMAQVRINPQLCIGYTYDHAFGKASITKGSHEIMLRYEFRYRVNAENPLYLK
ncbi:MAG: type IX secretion system membrane protein PorP/SprF [Bacteroidales bacterium]|jgi:type IX secretion system PorP/SprF family membrane protein|nr:type IX secretion system membrane protein PorP/SprF [Bacteroidales bacterium]